MLCYLYNTVLKAKLVKFFYTMSGQDGRKFLLSNRLLNPFAVKFITAQPIRWITDTYVWLIGFLTKCVK